MSVTLEDSANSIPVYIGHRELTEDDIRYNEELDKEDAPALTFAGRKTRAKRRRVSSLSKYEHSVRKMF